MVFVALIALTGLVFVLMCMSLSLRIFSKDDAFVIETSLLLISLFATGGSFVITVQQKLEQSIPVPGVPVRAPRPAL